jgi:signal transduction histidine kinase/ActR/RegA family two-component response regulator
MKIFNFFFYQSNKEFPITKFTLSLIGTALVLVALIVEIYKEKQDKLKILKADSSLLKISEDLKYYIVGMKASANLAYVTNSLECEKWKKRYQENYQDLQKSIEDAKQLSSELPKLNVEIDEINNLILQMHFSFNLLIEKKSQEVLNLDQKDIVSVLIVKIDNMVYQSTVNRFIDQLSKIKGEIMRLDESRTMATNLAILTKDLKWRNQYDHDSAQLSKVMNEAENLVMEDNKKNEIIAKIKSANKVVEVWERLVFDNIESGQYKAVQSIFNYKTYQRHKQMYVNGLEELTRYLESNFNILLIKENTPKTAQLLTGLMAILILIGYWVYVTESIRSWKKLVTEAVEKSRKSELLIREANDMLEKRVDERTMDLKKIQSEQLEIEKQMQKMQKIESIGRFAGGIAHDFNNILAVIMGYSDIMLSNEETPHHIKEYLRKIKIAGKNASTLTTQLLAFSRQQVLQPKIVDLNNSVKEIDAMLKIAIGSNIEIEMILDKNILPVFVDPSQINQVLMNLALNARDAMPNGGKIIIQTNCIEITESNNDLKIDVGGYSMLLISDNGTGMDHATKQKVFEPFFTTKSPGKGTGLGLATVYGIVKQSSGYIYLDSQLGSGTSFEIYFPVINREPVCINIKEQEVIQEFQNTDLEGLGVLIVEDELFIRDYLTILLENHKLKVFTAEDGKEGLAKFQHLHQQVDLIISDIVMPKMKGSEMIEAIRLEKPGVQVIFMSGYTQNIFSSEEIRKNNFNFLPKPIDEKALFKMIENIWLTEIKKNKQPT